MSLHLRQFPGDPARPALALHCMMGSGAAWGPIAEQLDGRVELHAPDLPGHGRSPAWTPGDGYFAEQARTHVLRLMDGLLARSRDGRIDLVGHSFGGVLALRLAAEAPDAVRSLTLIEPVMFAAVPRERRDPDALLAELARLEAAGERESATAAFLRYWDGPDIAALPPAARTQMVAQMAMVMDTMPDLYDDRGGILGAGRLEAIAAPVMLIAGAQTAAVIPAIAAALAQRLQDVGRATVPGAGHMAPITHPEPVAGLIAVNLDRA